MAFPNSVKNRFEILKNIPENAYLNKNILLDKLENIFDNEDALEFSFQDTGEIVFKTKKSLVPFEHEIRLKIEESPTSYIVNSEFFLDKLIQITVVIVVIIALFSYFNVTTFLIFSGVFAVLFYSINVIYISSILKSKLNTLCPGKNTDYEQDKVLDKNQKEWMKNPGLCPACGMNISSIDLYCPDCGLKVKQNQYSIPLDTTKYKDRTVVYDYKKKNPTDE